MSDDFIPMALPKRRLHTLYSSPTAIGNSNPLCDDDDHLWRAETSGGIGPRRDGTADGEQQEETIFVVSQEHDDHQSPQQRSHSPGQGGGNQHNHHRPVAASPPPSYMLLPKVMHTQQHSCTHHKPAAANTQIEGQQHEEVGKRSPRHTSAVTSLPSVNSAGTAHAMQEINSLGNNDATPSGNGNEHFKATNTFCPAVSDSNRRERDADNNHVGSSIDRIFQPQDQQ